MSREPRDLQRELDAIVDAARSHVIPLFVDVGRRRLRSAGSAVLIQNESGRLLAITAGHVLDGVIPGPLFTWGTRAIGLIRIRYSEALTSQPRSQRRALDEVDLAAIPIDDATADRLTSSGAVFAPHTMLSDGFDPSARFAFVGFPHSVSKIGRGMSANGRLVPRVPNTAVFALARAAGADGYSQTQADSRFNFVAKFTHSVEQRENEPKRPMPHPDGMSGGAAYSMGTSDDPTTALRELALVGVGTAYHETLGLFVAANVPSIRRLLAAF